MFTFLKANNVISNNRFLKQVFRQCHLNEIDDIMTDGGIAKQNYLLRELHKPSAEDFRLGEFTEKMIQYGYLVVSGLIFQRLFNFYVTYNTVFVFSRLKSINTAVNHFHVFF